MTMLLAELGRLAADPLAWGAIAALAGFTAHALWHWRVCPLVNARAQIDHAQAAAAIARPFVDGPRYLLLMLGGIAATVTGLGFIAEGIYPTLAFYLLLAGLFVIQTEPARREIREAELRVVASEFETEEARETTLSRLRSAHLWLVGLHVLLLVGAAAALLAFSDLGSPG